MKVRVHYEIDMPTGEYEDSIIIEGDTVEDIRKQGEQAVANRGGEILYSEEIK